MQLTSPVLAEIIGFQNLPTSRVFSVLILGAVSAGCRNSHISSVRCHAVEIFPLLLWGPCFRSHSPLGLGPGPGPLAVACTGAPALATDAPAPAAPAQPGPPPPRLDRCLLMPSSSQLPSPHGALFQTAPALGLDRAALPLLITPGCGSHPVPVRAPAQCLWAAGYQGGGQSPDRGRGPGTEPGCLCPPPGHISQPQGAASLLPLVPPPQSPSAPAPLTSLSPPPAVSPSGSRRPSWSPL